MIMDLESLFFNSINNRIHMLCKETFKSNACKASFSEDGLKLESIKVTDSISPAIMITNFPFRNRDVMMDANVNSLFPRKIDM